MGFAHLQESQKSFHDSCGVLDLQKGQSLTPWGEADSREDDKNEDKVDSKMYCYITKGGSSEAPHSGASRAFDGSVKGLFDFADISADQS